jgi:hypothetical protein
MTSLPEGDNLPAPEASKALSGETSAENMPASEFSKAQLLTNTGDALEGAPYRNFTMSAMLRGKSADLGGGIGMHVIGRYDMVGQLQQAALIAEQAQPDGSMLESYTTVAKQPNGPHILSRHIYHRSAEEVRASHLPDTSRDTAVALRNIFEMALRADPKGSETAFRASIDNPGKGSATREDHAIMERSLQQPPGESSDPSEEDVQLFNRVVKSASWTTR